MKLQRARLVSRVRTVKDDFDDAEEILVNKSTENKVQGGSVANVIKSNVHIYVKLPRNRPNTL